MKEMDLQSSWLYVYRTDLRMIRNGTQNDLGRTLDGIDMKFRMERDDNQNRVWKRTELAQAMISLNWNEYRIFYGTEEDLGWNQNNICDINGNKELNEAIQFTFSEKINSDRYE